MHRFTVSLLAFVGAVFIPPRDGWADPSAESTPLKAEAPTARASSETPKRDGKSAARVENGAKKSSDPEANVKSDANGKKAEGAPAELKKSSSGETNKKADALGSSSKKSANGDAPSKKSTGGPAGSKETAGATGATGSKGAPAWTRVQPGVVKLVRGSETLEVRVLDRKQHLVSATLPQFAKFLRAKSGADHPIDARLVTLVAAVSDHFGGRDVNVVSGFRPYSPRQYSRHSNHNEGRALDFSIKGIANETVRDFCRGFQKVGVGYYPNSLFVHLDVRDSNAYWVDYAAPGQAPRYHAPDAKDDDEEEAEGVVSVDSGEPSATRSTDSPREDVTRRHSISGRGGDRDTGDRGVFVDR